MDKKEFERVFKKYEVSKEKLHLLHSELLNMLKEFDKICSENNLRYSLAGGTLLGAIRHKGFIPWDDDVDIVMPHPDYENFISIVKEKYYNDYTIADIRENTCATLFVKFCKIGTKLVEVANAGTSFNSNFFIDIFPVENTPNNLKERAKIGKKFNRYRKMLLCAISYKYPSTLLKQAAKESKILRKEYSKKRFLGFLACLYGYKRLIAKLDKLSRYKEKGDYFVIPFGARYYDFELYKSDYFDKLIDADFEGCKFKISHRYEEYLKLMYGDYMKLPPVESRRPCHIFEAKLQSEAKNVFCILSSGSGQRFGADIPKQYNIVNGKMVIQYALDEVLKNSNIDRILLVISPGSEHYVKKFVSDRVKIIFGGNTRTETVANTIKYVNEKYPKCEKIVFHDSVRPFITAEYIDEILTSLDDNDAAITCQYVTDSLGSIDNIGEDRSKYFLIQTPEAFKMDVLNKYYDANNEKTAIVQHLDKKCKIAKLYNLRNNIKITYPQDIELIRSLLKYKEKH